MQSASTAIDFRTFNWPRSAMSSAASCPSAKAQWVAAFALAELYTFFDEDFSHALAEARAEFTAIIDPAVRQEQREAHEAVLDLARLLGRLVGRKLALREGSSQDGCE